MSKLTLRIGDIGSLHRIKNKIRHDEALTPDEFLLISTIISDLPLEATLLHEKFPLEEKFEIEVFSWDEMIPHIKRWVALFNSLPKQLNVFDLHADIVSKDDLRFYKSNVVIEASFIPSHLLSLMKNSNERTVGLSLLADGSAVFNFYLVEDAKSYHELYNFRGSWKQAFLMVVKTVRNGWPQTKFPEEWEQLLKKE